MGIIRLKKTAKGSPAEVIAEKREGDELTWRLVRFYPVRPQHPRIDAMTASDLTFQVPKVLNDLKWPMDLR